MKSKPKAEENQNNVENQENVYNTKIIYEAKSQQNKLKALIRNN